MAFPATDTCMIEPHGRIPSPADNGHFGKSQQGFLPIARHSRKRKIPPMVEVNIMAGRLMTGCIASLVGIDGMLGDVLQMLFIKGDQIRREGKNGQAVDPAVSKKAPIRR